MFGRLRNSTYIAAMITTMTTEQYAKEVYIKYSKTNTASKQRIRKMIKDGKELPQVQSITQSGKYYLLNVITK